MATRYVWSGATGSGTGADWTNAYTTLAAAVTAAAAGDDIRVAHDHAETASSSAHVTYSFPGTRTSPVFVGCFNRTTGALTTGAEIKTSGPYNITITGSAGVSGVMIDGIKFAVGDGATAAATLSMSKVLWYRNCTFECRQTTGGGVTFGSPSGYLLEGCWFKLVPSNAVLGLSQPSTLTWRGGGMLAGSANTILFNLLYQSATVDCVGLDLSALPAACVIFNTVYEDTSGTLTNCKLPASWAETSLTYSSVPYPARFAMYNCDSADTNYNTYGVTIAGAVVDNTTIYRDAGVKLRDQNNALTGYSLKCTTTSNAQEIIAPLVTDALLRNYPGTASEVSAFTPGGSKTVTVEITHSAAALLTDAQAWLEVSYRGTDGNPLGVVARTRRASPAATAVAHPTSTENWIGTAQTYKQKLQATITPQCPGVIEVRVFLATGNGVIVYVDPMITVS